MATLYISGHLTDDEKTISCPLQSSVILFIMKYCRARINLIFVSDELSLSSNICSYKISNVDNLSASTIEFLSWPNLPNIVKNVALPCIHQQEQRLVRSGLCVVLRHIIRDSHNKSPSLNLIDLLGFRQGSMKMCAEVSSWTKLCEVDISHSVTYLINTLKKLKLDKETKAKRPLTLSQELIALEKNFKQNFRVHNDNKRQRAEIAQLQDTFSTIPENEFLSDCLTSEEFRERLNISEENQSSSLNSLSFDDSNIFIQKTIQLSHGVRKFTVNKNLQKAATSSFSETCVDNSPSVHSNVCDKGMDRDEHGKQKENNVFNLSDLKAAVMELSFKDIEYQRVYSEGIELTIADLIIVTYVYHLLDAMDFHLPSLSRHLPCVIEWMGHMTSLVNVHQCGHGLGWNIERLVNEFEYYTNTPNVGCDEHKSPNTVSGLDNKVTFDFEVEEQEEEIELSRCAKMKHKALKPEVIQALQKFEFKGITPVVGSHPMGEEVCVDWDAMPDGVHPKEGNVPQKRTQRKCQQLENLATAVQSVAKPGDVIVDFCSGGGHLGILCAYLLPKCQVYLVENKEESLLRSSARLDSIGLDNIVLYQCNMDYFIGKFDVGLCLHACGSATDMVLELCTKSQASFVICPCCYGSIHNTHLLSYPRSNVYLQKHISYTDFMTIGHAADQTEFDIKLEKQGRMCMNLVDTDRAEYAKQQGYSVTLCSLQPLTCSPKNNLLIGTRC